MRREDQREIVFRLINAAAMTGGPAPRLQDLADALGLWTRSAAYKLVVELERSGRLQRLGQRNNCRYRICATGQTTAKVDRQAPVISRYEGPAGLAPILQYARRRGEDVELVEGVRLNGRLVSLGEFVGWANKCRARERRPTFKVQV